MYNNSILILYSNIYQVTLQVLLLPCNPELSATLSDYWQLNQFPYQVFLVRGVARWQAKLKTRPVKGVDECSCKVNGHLAQWGICMQLVW